MVSRIEWSAEAKTTYYHILAYLEKNWTEKELKKFISQTNAVLDILTKQPLAYQGSKSRSIRRAVVIKHNILYYRVSKSKIHLLSFWDTRQNPKKNKF